jgi:heparin binding hemagglutinin HbhA
MPNVPTIDVRKAGEQARAAVTSVFEQARTPFLAALGAGDVATQAVLDAVTKARAQVGERAGQARAAVDDLPSDMAGLRGRLDPAEVRKLVEQYADAAIKLYQYLSEHGEETLDRLRSQPQVKKAVEQFDQAAQAAQQRAESAVGDARELADEVLGKVGRRTRSTGEKTARATEQVADEVAETVAEKVQEAGAEAAHEVRSTSRKAANRATANQSTSAPSTSAPSTATPSTATPSIAAPSTASPSTANRTNNARRGTGGTGGTTRRSGTQK